MKPEMRKSISKGKVTLTKYENTEKEGKVATYSVEHNNGCTSLEQKLTLVDKGKEQFTLPRWFASIELEDFSAQATPEQAAMKLAEWLERMAKTIRVGDYTLPSTGQGFVDIKEEE